MSLLIFMWTVWAVLAVVLLALLLYRVSITQYEEDQLFLEEGANAMQQHQQEEIFSRLKRIRPAIRVLGGVEGFVTLAIAAFYVMDALRQF